MTRQRHAIHEGLKILQVVLFICGGLALGYSAFFLLDAHFYQKAAARHLHTGAAAPAPAHPSKATPQPVADGTPFARFEIPRLKLDAVVIEGDNDVDLRRGIGHIPGTAFPGSPGNVGIAGHRDTFFRPLRHIRAGDVIILTTARGDYRYRVESTEVVMPYRSDVLNPTPDPHLTLVTCFPFYYVGSAPKRFIVHAAEITPEQPGQPSAPEASTERHAPAGEHPGD